MPSPRLALYLALCILTAALAGCIIAPPVEPEKEPEVTVVCPLSVQPWLALQEAVSAMTPEQAVEQLVEMHRPEGVDQTFYYGLLNQRLETYGAWTLARDAFQELETVPDLHPSQRQLVLLLRDYNQNRINWYLRNRELQSQQEQLTQQLQDAEEEKAALESKIQALTDLEAVISTRKEE